MATITKSDELRLFNRSRILKCLRERGQQSRKSLGKQTGLSAATVTQVTADLIEDTVIEQITPANGAVIKSTANTRRGRPQVILKLRPAAATTAVLTLLLNEIEITLYDYAGNQLHNMKKRIATAKLSAMTLEKHIVTVLDKAIEIDEHYCSSLKHITLVCQGTVTSDNSGLLWSPITPVSDFDFRSKLRSRYGVSVTVSNDCNTIARALYFERQQHGTKNTSSAKSANVENEKAKPFLVSDSENNFAAILSSYGIGLGFCYQGTILTGSHSSGTEFGHMLFQADGALCRCGRYGCIEAYAADYAIWRRAKGLPSDTDPVDSISAEEFTELIDVAQRRRGPERDAFAEAGAAIGQGLTNLFAIFDPFPALMVGIDPRAFELMKESLKKNLHHYGTGDNSQFISVYVDASEDELIRSGASLQALSYIDEEIFGFGDRSPDLRKPVLS